MNKLWIKNQLESISEQIDHEYQHKMNLSQKEAWKILFNLQTKILEALIYLKLYNKWEGTQ